MYVTGHVVNLPVSLVFTCKVAYKKSWRSVHICKSYVEKRVAPFLFGHTVYHSNATLQACSVSPCLLCPSTSHLHNSTVYSYGDSTRNKTQPTVYSEILLECPI